MPLKEGDMVLIEYSVFIKETGELVETSLETIAKLHKKYREGEVYEPEAIVIGEGRFVEGFEEALKNAEVGSEYEVDVPPEKAYGPRDRSKVKTFSRRVFIRNNIVPEVGKEVTINNVTGRIIAVEGGRVVVDFNHPLAGKTLKFKFKILKKVEDAVEKVKYFIKRRLKKINIEAINVSKDDERKAVIIELPKEYRLADGVQIVKYLVSRDVIKWVPEVNEVVFTEKFTKGEFTGESGEQSEETA